MLYTYGYFPYTIHMTAPARLPAAVRPRGPFAADRCPERSAGKRHDRSGRRIFETAREAFKRGENSRALELVDQALKEMPDDPALHEFRG